MGCGKELITLIKLSRDTDYIPLLVKLWLFFPLRVSMTYTVHEEIVVTIFVEEVLLVTN